MGKLKLTTWIGIASLVSLPSALASPELLEMHCSKCHNDEKLKGDFSLSHLGSRPDADNRFLWEDSLDYVTLEEMPPPEKSELTAAEREQIVSYLTSQVRGYHEVAEASFSVPPRRLNNREFANSVRDVLLIEDLGTNYPVAGLLGDSLKNGFDTHGETLGLSEFHLEKYIESLRKVLDATILSGEKPKAQRYRVRTKDLVLSDHHQRRRAEKANRTKESIDILDIRNRVMFKNFDKAPATGWYKIKIRAMGVDRGVYDADATGMYHDDPIRLRVHLGDRVRDFDLLDEQVTEIELYEWIAEGTQLQLSHHTDGLRMLGNGNFKFQNRIAHDYIKINDPELYEHVVTNEVPKATYRANMPSHWVHWEKYWQGPRPRVFDAEVEGPLYESWPPKRQTALLGENPQIAEAEAILRPIAERAWRRKVEDGELDQVVGLARQNAVLFGDLEALKESIVTLMVSPEFLLLNPEEGLAEDRLATKLSYFLNSTIPDERLREQAHCGELGDFASVRKEVKRRFETGAADEFLKEFPQAWLQLDRINFMAPDPERYPLYDKKRLSEDMVGEVQHFFQHMVEENRPLTEFLSADYSYINADLAKIYEVGDVPQDSVFRKYHFADKRRGGLLGMGAFLTLTADSLATSPIHRAVYVMENLMGIHPEPPPADIEITEPDVRQAKTIKEILAAHTVEESCASCHESIDPWGFAFENFDPIGAWRAYYQPYDAEKPGKKELQRLKEEDLIRASKGLPPVDKPWERKPLPIDSSARFRNGVEYQDIVDFRAQVLSDGNRDRFVRCFVEKVLFYANGEAPDNYLEIERILEKSAENGYRIVDTIAAVIDSPLFREE